MLNKHIVWFWEHCSFGFGLNHILILSRNQVSCGDLHWGLSFFLIHRKSVAPHFHPFPSLSFLILFCSNFVQNQILLVLSWLPLYIITINHTFHKYSKVWEKWANYKLVSHHSPRWTLMLEDHKWPLKRSSNKLSLLLFVFLIMFYYWNSEISHYGLCYYCIPSSPFPLG